MLAGLHLLQGAQQFRRFDFADRPLDDLGFSLALEPAVALEGRL
jgi:hypothetical protein